MKYTNKLYMFLAACAIAMTACTDDMPQRPGTPVETGDAIMFASMLNGDHEEVNVNYPETRTHYGTRTETGISIRWDKNDTIVIFCPQASAPADHLVTYAITPSDTDSTKSGTMVKVDTEAAGLQWGSAKIHKFFGVYPDSLVKEAHEDDKAGIITATLPSTQRPKSWHQVTETIPGKEATKVYYGSPNMKHSLMLAYSAIDKDTMTNQTPIPLEFHNLVTVLDIVVQGPEGDDSITVTNINVEVEKGENIHICGDFNIHIDQLDDNKFICKALDTDKVTNLISIPCYDADKKKFITLGKNEALVVKAFLIPDTETPETFRQFRITVASLNGSANRMSLSRFTASNQQIKPRKINRILLPHLKKGEPVNWMANLDDNIYLTELSVPGSKMSYSTAENGANPVYQTATIKEQFATGIRAFIVQTGAEAEYHVTRKWVGGSIFDPYEYTYEFLKASSLPVHKAKAGTTLENTLDVIRTGLQERKSECAFLILTCEASAVKCTYKKEYTGGNGDGVDGIRAWTESLKYKLNELKTKYNDIIYTNEITKETTLGDVRGKLIIKVNTNNQDQEKYFTPDDTYPALFAIWENPANHKDCYSTVPLRWGTNNSNTTREPLNWMSAEVTHVGEKENVGENEEIIKADKEKSIRNILRAAVKDYNTIGNQHNTFYMVDAGGEYNSVDNPTQRLAKDMNELVVNELQTRKENASTGLIFMNFADRGIKQPDGTYQGSGQLYKSDEIIASIIDNNFKFALRKRSSTPTPPLR